MAGPTTSLPSFSVGYADHDDGSGPAFLLDTDQNTAEELYSLPDPFSVALPPPNFMTDDAPGQGVALESAYDAPDGERDGGEGFFDCQVELVRLSKLEKLYNEGHSSNAIGLLGGRKRIVFEGCHTVKSDDPDLFWEMDNSFLDLIVCVGKGTGLGPAIPNVLTSHNAEFTLDLESPFRQFTAKHVRLGFDPSGSMMWIGRSPLGEDTWLAFVTPDSQEKEEDEDFAARRPHSSGTSTSLSRDQQRRALVFLMTLLQKITYRDVVVYTVYPDVTRDSAFNCSTNILSDNRTKKFCLNFQQLLEFDRAMVSDYQQWIQDAPPPYKEDNFFQNRIPICVTSRYGQNQKIGINVDGDGNVDETEPENWQRDRDFRRVRYLTIAIATQLRVKQALRWQMIDPDLIVGDYEEGIFDSADPMCRRRLVGDDLEAFFEQAKDGEPPFDIFDVDGYHIQYRLAAHREADPSHGVLLKSEKLHHLFAPNIIYDDNDPDAGDSGIYSPTPFTFYPQAGLRTVGHFQARGLPTKCYPLVNKIDRAARSYTQHDVPSNIDTGAEDTNPNRRAIFGIFSQGYNAVVHHTRGRTAQHHDAQVGLVTAALAGAWAASDSSKRTASRILSRCTHRMPHAVFADKIRNPAVTRDLRIENVYYIDVQALNNGDRNGSFICKMILLPLTNIWSHGLLMEDLKKHIQLFKPEAFPALYKWTTFPLTSLLESIFEQAQLLYSENKFKHSVMVELCSVVERALNYMHTGNAAVIATTVMNPLWIGRAVVKDGFPCLNSNVVDVINNKQVYPKANQWPFNDLLRRPHSSSRRSHILTYGESHFNAFFAHLCMSVILAKPVAGLMVSKSHSMQMALSIAHHALLIFVQDCKDLIARSVGKAIRDQLQTPSLASHAQCRQRALTDWLKSSNPLAWDNEGSDRASTYNHLLLALASDPTDLSRGLIRANETWSYEKLATHFILASTASCTPAPITKNGFFATTLPLALEEIRRLVPKGPGSDNVIPAILDSMMIQLKIHYVPWHKPPVPGQRGPPPSSVSEKYWMFIDRGKQGNSLQVLDNATTEGQIQRIARETSESDPSAAWSVPDRLQDMGLLWKKVVLPTDWDIANASLGTVKQGGQYVIETYNRVAVNYDGGNWKHHIGLVWAILFTTILPKAFSSHEERARAGLAGSPEKVTQEIRNLRWTVNGSPGRKGATAKEPFITMLSTTIIALMDKESPLFKRIKRSKAMGGDWTDKHGAKGIHALALVRLGLAVAHTGGVITNPRYGTNWSMKSETQLKKTYDLVMAHLAKGEYGVYFAVQEIFGVEMADEIARNGHSLKPVFGGD